MSDTRPTFDAARTCPKCGQYGVEVSKLPGGLPGTTVFTFQCETKLCPWYETGWIVQVNADGSIPDRATAPPGPKQLELPIWATRQAERQLEELQHLMQQEEPEIHK